MKIVTLLTDFPSKDAPVSRVIVPTMGALHDGHLALIRHARQLAEVDGEVIVSIFVNPTQFNNPNDLEDYPRTLALDLALCEKNGVDIVFIPDATEMYCPDHSVSVIESSLSERLCGATRPGHFEGVCTVVLQLFHITGADIGIFGKKDYQQLAVIRRMVRDLHVPVQVIGSVTVREPSGLAMSSRNTRLTAPQHHDAARIRAALKQAKELYEQGEKKSRILLELSAQNIRASPEGAKIDYLELLDAETLQPVETVIRPAIIATAVFYGEVRLIDNIELF